MISKTIGFRGVPNIFGHTQLSSSLQGPLFWNLRCSVTAFFFAGLDPETDPAAVGRQRYRQIEGGDQKSNMGH